MQLNYKKNPATAQQQLRPIIIIIIITIIIIIMAITLFDIRVYVRPELSVSVLAFKFSEKYIGL